MKEAKINIRTTDIKSLKFENTFSAKPGEQMQLQVKNGMAIRLNPENPTAAVVFVKFEANDANGVIKFELETATTVAASTFVDNLDEVIKEKYLNAIMMSVNEKIKMSASMVGLNITTPPISFSYSEDASDAGSIDTQIFKNL